MQGKLIVIEGGDGAGKATQTQRLYERLSDEGYRIKKIEFPDYKSKSSSLIKMYLNGEFGYKADDVNPYAASTFYAVDRYASYKSKWENFINCGGIVLCDRYTTSNMIHQAVKINDSKKMDKYLNWLWNLEFELFELPVPDKVIFLDIPVEYSLRLIQERANKFSGNMEKDIHEKDIKYMKNAYYNSLKIVEKYSWDKVCCLDKDRLRTIEDIHLEVYDKVKGIIN